MTLSDKYGSAKRPDRAVLRTRPEGVTDAQVAAVGQLDATLDIVEEARGLLYAFHRRCGHADHALNDAIEQLRDAGLTELATEVADCLTGRDTLDTRWTFEVVEDYDRNVWSPFRAVVAEVHERAGGMPEHLYEAELKHREQQPGFEP